MYKTINVTIKESVCFLQLNRPSANNTINFEMIEECHRALDTCLNDKITIVVLKGLPEVFCSGADFVEITQQLQNQDNNKGAEPLYRLWMRLTNSHFISIAYVQGKTNAGGVGFVAACDIVIAEPTASFSLSELLFGLYPACVLPFLIRRIGFQKANYLTITTKPINAEIASSWGLVDDCTPKAGELLRHYIIRLSRLSGDAIKNYKEYSSELYHKLESCKAIAIQANQNLFANPNILKGISNYTETGVFPWERSSIGKQEQ